MTDAIKAFLQNSGLQQPTFASNSRYVAIETSEWQRNDGLSVRYVKRRFIPAPENFATMQEHAVEENDRLDNVSAKYFSDPGLYWRLCDANGVMKPEQLTTETGKRLRITLPEGIPEPTDEL